MSQIILVVSNVSIIGYVDLNALLQHWANDKLLESGESHQF